MACSSWSIPVGDRLKHVSAKSQDRVKLGGNFILKINVRKACQFAKRMWRPGRNAFHNLAVESGAPRMAAKAKEQRSPILLIGEHNFFFGRRRQHFEQLIRLS